MTDLHNKRKFAGAPIKDKRKHEPEDRRHLSPHKKPKVWTLTVEWTDTTTWRRHRKFTSRAARDEAKRRIERHFREQAAKAEKEPVRKYRWLWNKNSPFADFSDEQISKLKAEPAYIETYEDEQPDNGSASNSDV